ncbi:serine protease Vpr [Glycomyces halotolerans]
MPGHRAIPIAAVLLLPLLAAEPARADAPDQVWLVELEPGADAAAFASAAADHDIDLRHDFERIWNGVSVGADAATAEQLESLDPVERVWADAEFTGPGRPDRQAELALAVETTGAVDAHRRGIDGAGVRVGVIDTGIDYTHPDLGGCFGPGCRVEVGTDFVGDEYDSSDPERETPDPDDDPDDCAGHGTHVAGIVGADGDVTGAAPGVEFGAYKVFGCEGSTSAEVILQALERALADGMDVVNLSIGQPFQWPEYPTAEAADALVDEGVVVIASIGNSGEAGVFSASAPGVGVDVIGVASTDNPARRMNAARVEALDRSVGYTTVEATAAPEPGEETDPLVWLGRACSGDESEGDVAGRAALVLRGGCTFEEKYDRAVDEGATSVVVYNDRPGPFSGAGVEDRGAPMIAVTGADGDDLRDLARIGARPTVEFESGTVLVDLPRGGLASEFTSFGPAPDLTLKPDLAAPGGGIWSTWPVDDGAHRSLSGTSMSAPHVVGAAALLLQTDPSLVPASVRSRLVNTARPVPWGENPGLGRLEPIHRQGTGVLDIPAALEAGGSLSPSGVDTGHGTGPRTFEIHLTSRELHPRTYRLEHRPAIATTGDIRDPGFHVAEPAVTVEPAQVRLRRGQSATVTVTVEAGPDLPHGSVFGGLVVAEPDGGGTELAASYAGYHGDYLAIPVLEHPDYPKLAVAIDQDQDTGEADYRDLREGETFSIGDDTLPTALVYLHHMPRAMEVVVENTDTGETFTWDREEFLPRSAGPDDTAAIGLAAFDEDRPGVLEPGSWRMEVRVLKALGDETDPDHWEQWRSPTIRLAE